jgi:two-component sensor histidine kinase
MISSLFDTIMSSPDARSGEAFDQFETRVSEMEIEMNRLTSQTDQQAIRFSSLGFRGKEEANAWLAINEPSHDYCLFVDAHMVLEHVRWWLAREDQE